MRQFYEHIRVDAEALSFSAECAICGRKQYAVKLPLGCRNVRTLSGCVSGKANKISQTAFNHAKANATQQLALRFNQCRYCYRWVCDDCYDSTDTLGACRDCSKENENIIKGDEKYEEKQVVI